MTVPVRCRYATDPATRPHCQLAAVVRYGHTPLCSSCDQQRSTLGKGLTPTRLNTATDVDVLAWIGQAQRQLHTAEHELAGAVARARQHGQPWSAIATVLGISRQGAHQRFGDPRRASAALDKAITKGVDTPHRTTTWGIT